MITKRIPYDPPTEYLFLDQKRKQIAHIRKKIAKFDIDPNELVSCQSLIDGYSL